MATKKKTAGARRTTASTAKKKTASVKKAPAKPRLTKAEQERLAERNKQKNQTRAIILFACSIFLACLILIKGDNLWNWAHNAILGVLGTWAIVAPFLMIYVAISSALEKDSSGMGFKIGMTILVIVLFCGAGYIFGATPVPDGLEFKEFMSYLYTQNAGVGGGVIGGLLGIGLVNLAGSVGAKIIIILLLFVSLMILTRTTLVQLFKTFKKPVDVVSDGIQNAMTKREETRLLDSNADIDISLSDKMPDHPVIADNTGMIPQLPEKKRRRKNNEKLEKLHEAFGIDTPESASTESLPEESVDLPVLDKLSDEIDKVEFPMPTSGDAGVFNFGKNESDINAETVKSNDDIAAAVSVEQTATESPAPIAPVVPKLDSQAIETTADSEAARDAEKATSEFLKQHEESEKQESAQDKSAIRNSSDEKTAYCFPPITLLKGGGKLDPASESAELQSNGTLLVETLKSFGVQTKILDISRGPTVTRYELQPAAGVPIKKITGLEKDIAMNMAATGVRIEAPIPGKAAVGIELPNKTKNTVRMRELLESNSFAMAKSKLTVALGRDIAGKVTTADLGKMPHMLIAGTTGSGKSVCINSLIISTLYKASPDDVRFLMIDPKVVELGIYNGIPHLLVPVVTDPRKAAGALGWAVTEMLNRYKIFADCNVRDLESYNALAERRRYKDENDMPMNKMPKIVIIIDELSDLMMASPKEVEDSICRLAQMARAAGMHLVVATQRPSVDVVTGLIKANIPSRIAFAVSSGIDSRTILDEYGAEKLLGQGDMLFAPVGASKPTRVQGCFVSDEEIESVINFVKSTKVIEYDEDVLKEIEKNATVEKSASNDSSRSQDEQDPMLEEAIKCVVEAGQASTSLLQRRLRLGYARAGRLVDEMEQMGIVGPHEGSKPRQVLMTHNQWLEMNMQKQDEE